VNNWLAMIAMEESHGDATAQAEMLKSFMEWEALSQTAPNGKWRGANRRKWGKVGIEMRLTGNVPCTEGPVTHLGRMICKFVDIVGERTSPCGGKGPHKGAQGVVLSSSGTDSSLGTPNEHCDQVCCARRSCHSCAISATLCRCARVYTPLPSLPCCLVLRGPTSCASSCVYVEVIAGTGQVHNRGCV
jgi:hypothetical protein